MRSVWCRCRRVRFKLGGRVSVSPAAIELAVGEIAIRKVDGNLLFCSHFYLVLV